VTTYTAITTRPTDFSYPVVYRTEKYNEQQAFLQVSAADGFTTVFLLSINLSLLLSHFQNLTTNCPCSLYHYIHLCHLWHL